MSIVGASTSPGAGRVSPPPDAGPKWFRPGDPVPAELPTGRMRFEFTIPSAERKRLEGILSEMEVALMRLEAGAAHDAKGKAGARAGMGAANGRRKHRQRNDNQKLTAKELEATQAFAECESNYVRTANMLGLSRSATKERIQRAYKKLGQQVPKVTAKSKTLTIPTDQRGGESVSKDGRFG